MNSSPFVPNVHRPVPLLKFQIAPRIILLTSFWSKKKEPKYVCEWGQGFTLTQNMGWGFLFCSTPLTLGTVVRPHYVQMSSQGVMSSKQASSNPGLCPVKGQKPGLRSWIRARNKFLSLSLSSGKTPLHCHMLLVHPVFYTFSYTG